VKFNFKKIASVIASTVMLSSTVALAAAANYPSPFVQNGVADVAVVYSGSALAAPSDLVAATEITNNLNTKLIAASGAATTVSGGDFVKLERASDKFNLGDEMDEFYTSLDDEELSVVLATGVYTNDARDEFDYEQSINLGNQLNLTHFADSELDENEVPVIGFDLTNDKHILNYTLEFTDNAEAGGDWAAGNDLETTDITMLGRTYYVSSARNGTVTNTKKITLLDTANSAMIIQGESTTINVGGNSYDVAIDFIDSDEVMLNVNGVQTDKLKEGDTSKVDADLYVSVKSVLYDSKESGISKADISLGSGKIVLENNKEVQMNGEDISSTTDSVLNAYIKTSGTDLESITLEWILDDDAWIIPGNDLMLPGFETIKLSMGGFTVDKKEITKVEADGDDSVVVKAPIKNGDVTLNLLYLNSTNTGIAGLGEKDSHKLVTNASVDPKITLNESENSYFVATWISGDDAESYAYEIQSIEDDSGKNKTTLKNLADNSDLVFTEIGKTKDVGSLQLTLNASDDKLKTATIIVTGTEAYGDRVVTKDGLMFKLPVSYTLVTVADNGINLTSAGTSASWTMNFTEETKDGDISLGESVTAVIAADGDDGLEPTTLTGVTMIETEDGSDQYEGYVVSELATKFFKDQPTSGLNKLEVEYHDSETSADVYISETGTAVIAEGGGNVVFVTDAESTSAKNLIVVGGSCINSVAADLLGGALCGADFEASTGVGAGSFLIETFARDGGGVATLVAGYNAQDTRNAATALTTQVVDTTAGKKYTGTTATSIVSAMA